MTGTAGDAHIWTITTDAVPLAACGYSPPTEDILSTPEGDDEPVVLGQQVVHAAPTGVTCEDCIAAASTEPEG